MAQSLQPDKAASAAKAGITVGDKVSYIPGEVHALDHNLNGEYPWIFGWRKYPNAEVEELRDERVAQVLEAIKRHPAPDEERKKLILLRPREVWPAVVRAVNNDGTLDLDIQSNNGGVTLHYSCVPFSDIHQARSIPHSCHAG